MAQLSQEARQAAIRSRRSQETIEELMRHHEYTPRELSSLLGMNVEVILHEIRTGQLRATTLNHRVQSIRREDVIDWLQTRG